MSMPLICCPKCSEPLASWLHSQPPDVAAAPCPWCGVSLIFHCAEGHVSVLMESAPAKEVPELVPLGKKILDPLGLTSGETVNHPPHYGGDTVYEVIKVLEAWDLGFHLGNVVKYVARAGKKGAHDDSVDFTEIELEDLRKARWYLDRHIQRLEEARS